MTEVNYESMKSISAQMNNMELEENKVMMDDGVR